VTEPARSGGYARTNYPASAAEFGHSPDVSFHLLDSVVASEHEIDGEEVLIVRARIGSAEYLGSAGDRDHHAFLVAGDLHGRGGLAWQSSPDHLSVDPVGSGDHHRPSVDGSIRVSQHVVLRADAFP
jgi:hypothetical protein